MYEAEFACIFVPHLRDSSPVSLCRSPLLAGDIPAILGCDNGGRCDEDQFCCVDGTCADTLESCGETEKNEFAVVVAVGGVRLLVFHIVFVHILLGILSYLLRVATSRGVVLILL